MTLYHARQVRFVHRCHRASPGSSGKELTWVEWWSHVAKAVQDGEVAVAVFGKNLTPTRGLNNLLRVTQPSRAGAGTGYRGLSPSPVLLKVGRRFQ